MPRRRDRHDRDQAFSTLFTILGELNHFAWDVWRYFHRIEKPSRKPLKHLIRVLSADLIAKGLPREDAKLWLHEFILFLSWIRGSFGTRLDYDEKSLLERTGITLLPLRDILNELVFRYFPQKKSLDWIYKHIKQDPLLQRTIPEMIVSDLPSERLFKKTKNRTYLGLINTSQKYVFRQLPLQLTSQLVTINLPWRDPHLGPRYQKALPTVNWKTVRELKSIDLDWDHLTGAFRERVHETDKMQLQSWMERWFLINFRNSTVQGGPQKIHYLPKPDLLQLHERLGLLDISYLSNNDVFVRMKLSDDDFLFLHFAMMAANLHRVTHFAKRWMFRYLGWLFFMGTLHYYCTEIRPRGKTLDERLKDLAFYGDVEADDDPFKDNTARNPYLCLFEEEYVAVHLATAFVGVITALRRVPVDAAGTKKSRIEFYYQQPSLTSFTLLEAAKSPEMYELFKKHED